MFLMDFARGYDKALERRMDAEQYADFRNFNGTPVLKTEYSIENQMSNFRKSWREAYIILQRVTEVKVQSRAGRSIDLKSVLGVRVGTRHGAVQESQSSVGADDNFNVQSDALAIVPMYTFSTGTPICTQTSQACVIRDPHIVHTKGRTSKRMKGQLEHPRSGPKLCRGCNQLVVGHDKRNCPQSKNTAPISRSDHTADSSIGRGRGRGWLDHMDRKDMQNGEAKRFQYTAGAPVWCSIVISMAGSHGCRRRVPAGCADGRSKPP
ncbi:hypothetical protein ACLOJK_003259 [Asimina triloba]